MVQSCWSSAAFQLPSMIVVPTAAAVDLTGIPQEGIFLGPSSANVTLIEYADLQCPFCRAYGRVYGRKSHEPNKI